MSDQHTGPKQDIVDTIIVDPWTDVATPDTEFRFRLGEVLEGPVSRIECRLWQYDDNGGVPTWHVIQDWCPWPPQPQTSKVLGHTAFQIDLRMKGEEERRQAIWLGNLFVTSALADRSPSLLRVLTVPIWNQILPYSEEIKTLCRGLTKVFADLRAGVQVAELDGGLSIRLDQFQRYHGLTERARAFGLPEGRAGQRVETVLWVTLTIAEGYRRASVRASFVTSVHLASAHCGMQSVILHHVLEALGFASRLVGIEGPQDNRHAMIECIVGNVTMLLDPFAGAVSFTSAVDVRSGNAGPDVTLSLWPDQEPALDPVQQVAGADRILFDIISEERTTGANALAVPFR